MPNLNLTHSGNMNITSASFTSGGTLEVAYGKNETGAITGWSFNSDDEFESGQTYTVYCYPKTSGTVLSESFTVSGIDEEDVPRSDTSILRQGYDSDFRHYIEESGERLVQMSPDTPRDIPMQKFRIDAMDPGSSGYYFLAFSRTPNDDYATIFSFSMAPDENLIIDAGNWYSITGHGVLVSGSVYDYTFSEEIYFAYAEENAPFNQVWYFTETGGIGATGLTIDSSATTENYVSVTFTVTGDIGDTLAFRIPTVSGSVDALFTSTITGEEPEPVPGTLTRIRLIVPDEIVDSGWASYSLEWSGDYQPIVDLVFTSDQPSIATIDPVTGEITVLQDANNTWFKVEDRITGLYGWGNAAVYKTPEPPGPDTGSAITSLTLSSADEIVGSGVVVPVYAPSDVPVSLVYSSTDTSKATIDQNGNVTVLGDGTVTLCVEDEISGLIACKQVSVRLSTYIDSITISVPDDIFLYGQATATYTPQNAIASLEYSSSNPSIATINQTTGQITALQDGTVTFCVRDIYTNKSDCKTVSVSGDTSNLLAITYYVTDTSSPISIISNTNGVEKAYYNGQEITVSGTYTFPQTGLQTIYYKVTTKSITIEGRSYTGPSYRSFAGLTSIYDVRLPDNWGIIPEANGYGYFEGCSNLRSVICPYIKAISCYAFAGTKVETINLPYLEILGSDALSGSSIAELTLPDTLVKVSFNGATHLNTITFEGTTPPSIYSSPYNDLYSLLNIFVPCISKDAYKAIFPSTIKDKVRCTNFNSATVRCYFDVTEGDNRIATKTAFLNLAGGDVEITGGTNALVQVKDENGANIPIVSEYSTRWWFNVYSATSGRVAFDFVVDMDVVNSSLGFGPMFAGTNLVFITLPDTITHLGKAMFSGSSLSYITIPSSVTYLDYLSFGGCSRLYTIYALPTTQPELKIYDTGGVFQYLPFASIAKNGALFYPSGSNYSTWLSNDYYKNSRYYEHYLGYRSWTGSPTL